MGDVAECDDVGVGVGVRSVDEVGGLLRLSSDAKRLVYLVLQQN
jgi:hypothetical protein